MTFKTHIAFAEMVALPPILYLYAHHQCDFETLKLYTASVATGAVLPDIDHTRSYISRKVPVIPHLLALYTKHRGFTHSLLGILSILLLLALTQRFLHIPIIIALGLGIGYILHIIADAMTVSGIKNFCCHTTLYTLPKALRCKTGSIGEYFYFFLFSSILFGEFALVDPKMAHKMQTIITHSLHIIEKSL